VNFVEASGKLGLMAALLAALALSGCGRKGSLDLPPQAQATGQPAAAQPVQEPARASRGGLFDQDDDDRPAPVQGQKRRIILDSLLD
jgi:predicted small lipoprotein YifL